VKKNSSKKSSNSEGSTDNFCGELFRGLVDLVGSLGKIIDTNREHKGNFSVKRSGENAEGIYGYSIRSNICEGRKSVRPFGSLRGREERVVIGELIEPFVQVINQDNDIIVRAKLPGVMENEILTKIQDNVLIISTNGGRNYATKIKLPEKIITISLTKTYRNGMLEIILKKATVETGREANDT
jgi:HSP20 family protein